MSTAVKSPVLNNNIFIVYTSHEQGIAKSLKVFLEQWGYHTFFCRQMDDRRSLSLGTYIAELRGELNRADLVIFILSQEFQWSKYAQGEIGATMFKGTPRINLLIPPADLDEVRKIAPMLEDHECIVTDVTDQETFFSALRSRLKATLNANNGQAPADVEALKNAQQDLWDRILDAVQDYKWNLPSRIEARVWASIRKDTPAHLSIVENIKNSLRTNNETTQLVFVGTSLKFSLAMISQALQEFASEVVKAGGRLKSPRKKLKITLIYMDDLSHILHTLNDYDDIRTIRRNLNGNVNREKTWEKYCREASIILEKVVQKRIDYIPPRVGILIDGEKLYAGQCYFEPAGIPDGNDTVAAYRLLVGEREYFYYTNKDERGVKAIGDFNASVAVYSDPKNNGVMLALNRNEWMERLRSCIETYEDVQNIILISETCSKFADLVTAALSDMTSCHGPKRVKIYVRDPNDTLFSSESQSLVNSLERKIHSLIGGVSLGKGCIEIYYYRHEPTFRAVLIGNAVLGVQMYERSQGTGGNLELKPGPLRIIAARYSAQFPGLKEMVDRFLSLGSVDDKPRFTIGSP